MKQIKLLLAAFFIVIFFADVNAQGRNENYWFAGGSINAFNYFGDLNPLSQRVSTNFSFTRPNIGIEVGKRLSPRLAFKASLAWGRLRGDDFESGDPDSDDLNRVARWGRNLHFRNDIIELGAIFTYDLLPSRGRFYRRRYFTPYLLAGVAGFYHNPKAKTPESLGGEWVALEPLNTEGPNSDYSKIQLAFPLGFGLKWRISDRLDLSFEMAFRILMFDHLDDVGAPYPDINELESDLARALYDRSSETTAAVSGESRVAGLATMISKIGEPDINYGREGQIRGNSPGENDMYLVTGLHLTYIFRTNRHPRLK